MNLYRILGLAALLIQAAFCQGQKHTFTYEAELGGAPSSSHLPFWLYSNQYGKINADAYLWGTVGVFTDFSRTNPRTFDYAIGAEGTGSLGNQENRIFLNQLYARIRWQKLVLDLGMTHPPLRYDGLSSTNGNMLYSTNARSLPGISLSTCDFIKLPWIGKWVAFEGKYAEYTMIDDRYAGNRTRLHNKMLGIRFTVVPQFSFEVGLEHYAQWGGETPQDGKLPSGFKDYLRVILIKEGGEDAPDNEINKLGNHIGNHFIKATYNGKRWGAEFYYNHIFEDGSGEKLRNRPDGLYGIYVHRNHPPRWFKSFVYEFYYTKCQSGPYHNDPLTGEIVGGNDNYFNNGIYQSGWTYYGRVIGAPFFLPKEENEAGLTLGVQNNRFVAHHIGICGVLPMEIQYRLLMSYSHNYGLHHLHYINETGEFSPKSQFSLGAEFTLPENKVLPVNISLTLGLDQGEMHSDKFGALIKIFKTGIFK